jgi:hypothetical protein
MGALVSFLFVFFFFFLCCTVHLDLIKVYIESGLLSNRDAQRSSSKKRKPLSSRFDKRRPLCISI